MRPFASGLLVAALLVLSLVSSARAELALEPMVSYIAAGDRVPGFQQQRNPNENWVLQPLPAGWREVSLDGTWKAKFVSDKQPLDYFSLPVEFGPLDMNQVVAPGYSTADWPSVKVPWPVSFLPGDLIKTYEGFCGYAYYQRTIDIPSYDPAKESVYIKFYGAGYRGDVWLNQTHVGQHIGVFSPFEFDLTSHVKPGQKATLTVRAVHTRYGMNWRSDLETGLYDTVRLQVRGKAFPQDVKLAIDDAQKQVVVHYQWPSSGSGQSVEVEATILEYSSNKPVATARQTIQTAGLQKLPIKLDSPRYWSPEDPFLYRLSLKIDGREQAAVRFGYRTLEIKAGQDGYQHFYLNGKRFYMRAFEYNNVWNIRHEYRAALRQTASINDQGRLREHLLLMKFMNVNTLRPHSAEVYHQETFFNLCDELGILVYMDWSGGSPYLMDESKNGIGHAATITTLQKNLPNFVRALTYLHNHPSLAFVSYQNELYDHLLPKGMSFDGVINQYYQAQKATDLQNRFSSGSTGRPTYRHHAKVDFVDDHQYIGVYYGSWQDVLTYLKETPGMIKTQFKANLPFVNMETGEVIDYRVHDINTRTWTPQLKQEIFDKNDFIAKATADDVYRSYGRLAMNAGGLRLYLTDLAAYRQRKSYLMVKRYLEAFRMMHATNDGLSLNSSVFMLASYTNGLTPKEQRLEPWPDADGRLIVSEPIYSFRTGYYPVQAIMKMENPHVFSGDKTQAPLVLVNDSERDAKVDMVIQLRSEQGALAELHKQSGLAIKQGEHRQIPFELAVPATWQTGANKVEIYLMADGKKIAENYYHFYTVSPRDRTTVFPARKVALYDTVAKQFAGLGMKSTGSLLKSMKIPYTLISDFNTLDQYEVLLIGANSIDATLSQSGPQINRWIIGGGRLFMFEQCVGGPLPWASDERIMLMGKSSFMENYYKKHPMFKGIEDEMAWESPMGNYGRIFNSVLELNDGFLSLASVGNHEDTKAIKSVINNRRMGKGEYVVSMVLTTDRYGKDSTISRYVENAMAYILGDSVSPYAVAMKNTGVSTAKVMTLDAKDAVYIDLRAAANQGFADEIEGDKQGGWTDSGAQSDMRNIPLGRSTLSGSVAFDIIDPAKNQGKSCIVLGGSKKEYFPKQSPVIAVNQRLDKLFFLHTSMWATGPEGQSILEYEIQYEQGEKVTLAMRKKVDIGDWWMAKDYPNAQVVYRDGDKCLFATEWVNPQPKRTIVSIKAISTGQAIPVVIAITGQKTAKAQTIDRTEAEDNRK